MSRVVAGSSHASSMTWSAGPWNERTGTRQVVHEARSGSAPPEWTTMTSGRGFVGAADAGGYTRYVPSSPRLRRRASCGPHALRRPHDGLPQLVDTLSLEQVPPASWLVPSSGAIEPHESCLPPPGTSKRERPRSRRGRPVRRVRFVTGRARRARRPRTRSRSPASRSPARPSRGRRSARCRCRTCGGWCPLRPSWSPSRP